MPMGQLNRFMNWWRPLPLWLKGVTAVALLPAWLFTLFCVLSGQEKSASAFLGFGVFAGATLLHIIFDRRNRRGGKDGAGGVDFGGGGD